MKTKLKAELEDTIQKLIDKWAENGEYDFYIHPELCSQMTSAAELAFDIANCSSDYTVREATE